MKNSILSLAIMCCTTAAYASAPYSIRGTVRDAMTAETLPGATCTIYQTSDTIKPIISTMADAEGNFSIPLDFDGSFTLKVTMVGQKPSFSNFSISKSQSTIDLGTIALQPEGEALEEVVVTGRRPVIESTGDKVAYNLTEDPTTQTHTAIEMLRKVPMVTVDAQDNIYINGQSNFKIYLNGKEDPMLSKNASTVLKSLPAVTIKRIEVILDPGAKYDAEGVAGILNIITETQASTDGQLATITLGGGAKNAQASIYAMAKKNKVTASVDLSYYNRFDNASNSGSIHRETFNVETPTVTDQKIKMNQRNQFINGNANLSWEPNDANLFTLSASGYGGFGKQTFNSLTDVLTIDNTLQNNNRQSMRTKWVWTSLTVNAGYQHNFDTDGQNMVLSYQYVHGWDKNKTYTTTLESSLENYSPCIYNYTNSPTNEHTVQLDYTKPFATWFTLESGVKGIFRRNSSDGYTKTGNEWSALLPTDYNEVSLSQNQDVAAAYATYAGAFGKFGLKAGIRYEYTRMTVKFKTSGYDNFHSNLNDWVPNASLTYSITPAQNIYASYQQRIRRPGVEQLNPHQTEYISGFITKGNPSLTSEKTHTFAVAYSNFAGKLGINFRTFYSFSNNTISQYSYEQDGNFITTYNNLGDERKWGLNGFAKYQVNGAMDFSLNATVDYTWLRHKAEQLHNDGWSFNLNANFNYTMPWSVKLNAYGGFSTKHYSLQGYMTGWNYHGLSFTKTFGKNDFLKITLSGNNFIAPHMNFRIVNQGHDFSNIMRMRVAPWDVSCTIAVTLGGLKSSVKKTASQIHNDDVQQSQGGGASLGN